jgi:hypothetical protein
MTTFLAAAPMFSSVCFLFFHFGSCIAMITVLSLFWAVYLMALATAFELETKGGGWLYWDVPVLRSKWKHLSCNRVAQYAISATSAGGQRQQRGPGEIGVCRCFAPVLNHSQAPQVKKQKRLRPHVII